MTKQQKETILKMRRNGCSYTVISKTLGISENTLKSYCRRNNLGMAYTSAGLQGDGIFCRQCGASLFQTAGVKHKRFCSDKCRLSWWNDNPELINRTAIYTFICPTCSREFTSYGNKHRKYCSRACYMKERFGNRPEGGDRE